MYTASIGRRDSDKAKAAWTVFRIPAGARNFFLLQNVQIGSEAFPASCSVDTGCFFSAVKRPGRKADNVLPSSAEDQNEWCYTAMPLI